MPTQPAMSEEDFKRNLRGIINPYMDSAKSNFEGVFERFYDSHVPDSFFLQLDKIAGIMDAEEAKYKDPTERKWAQEVFDGKPGTNDVGMNRHGYLRYKSFINNLYLMMYEYCKVYEIVDGEVRKVNDSVRFNALRDLTEELYINTLSKGVLFDKEIYDSVVAKVAVCVDTYEKIQQSVRPSQQHKQEMRKNKGKPISKLEILLLPDIVSTLAEKISDVFSDTSIGALNGGPEFLDNVEKIKQSKNQRQSNLYTGDQMKKEAKYFDLFSQYDMGGGMWELDKQGKRLKRKEYIKKTLEKGSSHKFDVGDLVVFGNFFGISHGKISELLPENYYKVADLESSETIRIHENELSLKSIDSMFK